MHTSHRDFLISFRGIKTLEYWIDWGYEYAKARGRTSIALMDNYHGRVDTLIDDCAWLFFVASDRLNRLHSFSIMNAPIESESFLSSVTTKFIEWLDYSTPKVLPDELGNIPAVEGRKVMEYRFEFRERPTVSEDCRLFLSRMKKRGSYLTWYVL
jgi:hypothetical protein